MATGSFGPDTVDDFERAAIQRFAEALHLANHFPGGAVYLWGYVAEMYLKAATLRLIRGGATTAPIDPVERDAVEKMIKKDLKLHPNYAQLVRGQHNFLGWAHWLVLNKPIISGAPYPLQFGQDLIASAEAVYNIWDPNMRYHELAVTPAALAVVRTATEWLRSEYPNM
ncbi:MAG: hypothetical protein K2R98_14520 [Gemmataceae bacterium]|nr:hypothetical protein [Gemmataceae bacterium]